MPSRRSGTDTAVPSEKFCIPIGGTTAVSRCRREGQYGTVKTWLFA